jgi:beta-glucosidase
VKGEEVLQVYLKKIGDANGPIKTLRAFKKVELLAGKKKVIDIVLNPDQLEWFDTETNTIKYSKGMYEILYGNSSASEGLKRTLVEFK